MFIGFIRNIRSGIQTLLVNIAPYMGISHPPETEHVVVLRLIELGEATITNSPKSIRMPGIFGR